VGYDDDQMRHILAALTPREQEALKRFYVLGQDVAEVLRDMDMCGTEFRELKSRVKRQYRDRHRGDAN